MKKKIMLLGGNYFQMTATKSAKELGHYVISVDYLPDNPAHQYADVYYNVSTTDKEAVLRLARELDIDGIVSYASDVSAPTAAYVAEQLNLPTNPYESVVMLTRKDFIRPFMEKHNFNVPRGKQFSEYKSALEFFRTIKKPAMIKPVDASGSKGVSKVFDEIEFEHAYQEAMYYSMANVIIIEEFIQRDGYQIAGDGFIIDGKLEFAGLMNEHFDKLCNPLVPIGESFPSVLPDKLKEKAEAEIQRLLSLLDMKFGAINLDFIVDKEGDVYILEIGPRNGGNLITDAIYHASGIDLAKYTVQAALDEKNIKFIEPSIKVYTASYVVHSLEDGIYKDIWISEEIKKDIVRFDMFVKKGEKISKFNNGSFGIGAMIIEFSTIEEMLYRMDNMEEYIKVLVE